MLSNNLGFNPVGIAFSEKFNFDSVEIKKSSARLMVCREILNEIIDISNFSVKKVSEETGIPLNTLYQIKSGKTKYPRSAIFHKIFYLYCRFIAKD